VLITCGERAKVNWWQLPYVNIEREAYFIYNIVQNIYISLQLSTLFSFY